MRRLGGRYNILLWILGALALGFVVAIAWGSLSGPGTPPSDINEASNNDASIGGVEINYQFEAGLGGNESTNSLGGQGPGDAGQDNNVSAAAPETNAVATVNGAATANVTASAVMPAPPRPQPAPQAVPPPPEPFPEGFGAVTFLLMIASGALGGLVMSWFLYRSFSKRAEIELEKALHKEREKTKALSGSLSHLSEVVAGLAAAQGKRSIEPAPPAPARPSYQLGDDSVGFDKAPRVDERPPPPPVPTYRPAPQNPEEIGRQYQQLIAGSLSRDRLDAFFQSVGKASAAESVDEDNLLRITEGGDEKLVAVQSNDDVFVFPSFQFLSSSGSFNTRASVPTAITNAFNIQAGDGQLSLQRPAIYRWVQGRLERQSKGEMGGFLE